MINSRLLTELEHRNAISNKQYGFRTGRSTIGAMEEIIKEIETACNRPESSRLIPCIVTIDIINAFNSASWELILKKIKEPDIPTYLRKIINSYLSNRKIIIHTEEKTKVQEINSGVPQGSVLGPTLWNVLYDDILKTELPKGVFPVAYADDLALNATAKTTEELKEKIEKSMESVLKKMNELRLEIAKEKTEILVIRGRRKLMERAIFLEDKELKRVKILKYLGVGFNERNDFSSHIDATTVKAAEAANNLCRILPNIGGPSVLKRKMLAAVVNSILLYRCEAWGETSWKRKDKERILSVQRKMILRVISAYRTASTEAALVVAGTLPIHILVEERKRIWEGEDAGEAREKSWERWQEEWEQKGKWTGKVIRKVRIRAERNFGELDHHAAQFFLRHGCFGTYLKRFGIAKSDACAYCGKVDTTIHRVLKCDRWVAERENLFGETGTVTIGNMAEKMLKNEGNWKKIAGFISGIMKRKNQEEKKRKEEDRNKEETHTNGST